LLHKVLQYFGRIAKLSNLKAMDGEQRVTAIDAPLKKYAA